MSDNVLRGLPSVDEVLKRPELIDEAGGVSHGHKSEVVRLVIDRFRSEIRSGSIQIESIDLSEAVVEAVIKRLRRLKGNSLKRVINASGVVLHTNLGRAVLCDDAVEALERAASTVNIEYDIDKGGRGERDSHVEELVCLLTGAEAACVVNNNAAAVLIALNTFAEGKAVVVSRGELIEIGGSFRLPEIIEKSGCVLKEVGTTNRTHPSDYACAIDDDTAVLLKAHTSNYSVVGFTSEVKLKELVAIARKAGVAVVEDLGSGSLVELEALAAKSEPVVSSSVGAGADVVTFSGDKLLGGPQAGIIVGKKLFIDRIRKNPLKRALRVDKLTMAALEATLKLYLDMPSLAKRLPAIAFLTRDDVEEIRQLSEEARKFLKDSLGDEFHLELESGYSQVGSGSLPGHELPTVLVTITHENIKPERLFKRFLSNDPPILGRVSRDKFILDLRTVTKASDVVPGGLEQV